MSVDTEDLALREATRALEHQREAIQSYEARGGTILAAATIATGVLAQAAGPFHRADVLHGALALVAAAAFVGIVWNVVRILQPARLELHRDPMDFIRKHIDSDQPLSAPLAARQLTTDYSSWFTQNAPRLERQADRLQASGILLVVEMLAWLASIAVAGR